VAKALAEFKLGKHFYGTKRLCCLPLCKILYFVGDTELLAEKRRWGCTIDQKVVEVHGSPCAPTTRIYSDTTLLLPETDHNNNN
jgi:hypothetical protein